MQSPASSLFLLVLCEGKPAKTENVRTDAGDTERAAAAGQRGPIAGGSMKRRPHVDGYYSSDGREAQRARPVQVPDDVGWRGRGEPRGSSGRRNAGSGLGAVGRGARAVDR